MEKPRFSMLLLEPGEIYFEDFSCTMRVGERASAGNAQCGRLKLCSKSLVFEPRGRVSPLIKLQYRDTLDIAVVPPITLTDSDNLVCVKVKQFAEMLENNIIAPYEFRYTEQCFYFTLDFVSAENCVAQAQQLRRASTLSAADHSGMITAISHSRYTRAGFDTALMEDASEPRLLELGAERVTPLVRNPGRLALTSTALYFQPFNNVGTSGVLQMRLSELRRVLPRRFLLQQVGVEVYGSAESSAAHLYLVLESESERDALCERLTELTAGSLETVHPEEMTLQWQSRLVSNYEYLLYLNRACERLTELSVNSLETVHPEEMTLQSDPAHLKLQISALLEQGVEVYGSAESSAAHLYLVLESESERDALCERLTELTAGSLETVHPEEMTLQWQSRLVSNYEYLLYLNSLADRSLNDLTQYPVLPWVVADYSSESLDLEDAAVYRDLSKPVGALEPLRLARLKERYREMAEPKFLYGSHYSAPALVLFYLVRKYPHYMLCLQNGRFDHPDRMFNSVSDAYRNCLHNMSDFKELVPEFYDTSAGGDFLRNVHEIDFGERHDGARVGDVQLPRRACSPQHFVSSLRAALESEYVSRHLHLWIDLIFGYKQRGEEAIRADNVFHATCYEGGVSPASVREADARLALEVQVLEFGQVPTQLFTRPHVRRLRVPVPHHQPLHHHANHQLRLLHTVHTHSVGAGVTSATAGAGAVVVGRDGVLKVYSGGTGAGAGKQMRSVALSPAPLTCCVALDPHTVAVGSLDNHIYVYEVQLGRCVDTFRAHDDSVTCLLWLESEEIVVSGGADCTVRVWSRARGASLALKGLLAELEHDACVTALATLRRTETELQVGVGTSDGCVCVWSARSWRRVHRVCSHTAALAGLCLLHGERLASVDVAGHLRVTDLAADTCVYKTRLCEEAMCATGGAEGRTLWVGTRGGAVLQWDVVTTELGTHAPAHHGGVTGVCWVQPATLLTTGEDATLKLWTLRPLAPGHTQQTAS